MREDGDNAQQAVLKCSSPTSHTCRRWENEMHATSLWSACQVSLCPCAGSAAMLCPTARFALNTGGAVASLVGKL